ncbi:hypothetical protein [Paenibacillus sp. HJGM_3]|uniref:hypothetical protein n=1 Tax=Paenibacillus sp. HJGM_3 TaxID=3379816 RepID=UPI003857FD3B
MYIFSLRGFITLIAALFTTLTSCSIDKDTPLFNHKDLKINLVRAEKDFGAWYYDLELQNTGKIEIGFISLFLGYPIKVSNGSKSNPFKVEGATRDAKPIKLGTNEKITFHVVAPVEEVFGATAALDFDHPSLEIKGYAMKGDQAIPFGISGSLELLVRND